MRIRPFFWILLIFVCVSVLAFAAVKPSDTPAVLHVEVDQHSLASAGMASLYLRLTDPQGLPIEEAHVIPAARMTNMAMPAPATSVKSLGGGVYVVRLALDMAGPWAITILARADGFSPQQQTLLVQVR